MNSLIITKSIINEIYDERSFKNEISGAINSLIDDEMKKEEPDFDYIDECVDALIEVQAENYSAVIPFIIKNRKHKALSIFFACAVILSLSFGAVAVNYTAEKLKEEHQTESTAPQTTLSTTAESTATVTEKATKVYATNLDLSFSDNFKSVYKQGDKISLSGITVNVAYSDGTRKRVDINDCKIVNDDNLRKMNGSGKVTVEYDGVRSSFNVMYITDLKESAVSQYTGFEKKTEVPEIQTSEQYVELKTGERACIAMSKSNDGFVCFTADNDNLDDISVSYQGGVNGRQIFLNITAGQTAGITTVSLAYERNPDDIMAKVTVKVTENNS